MDFRSDFVTTFDYVDQSSRTGGLSKLPSWRQSSQYLLPFSNSERASHSPQDTWLYNIFRAQLSSHEREIDFHVSLK